MPNKLQFSNVVAFAQFCAELTRQGIAFNGAEHGGDYFVTLTGY